MGDRDRRLTARLGAKHATVAIARPLLAEVAQVITDGPPDQEPVPVARGALAGHVAPRRHVRALETMGDQVILQPTAA